MTSFKKMSKKQQKEELKKYRKPPMPAPKISDSKVDRDRKYLRLEKQNKYKNAY